MRFWLVIFSILSFCIPAPASADELVLEGGFGVYESNGSQAAFLRYQKYVTPFLGLDSYYDLAVADWNGENHNSAIILTKGFRWNVTEKIHADFEGGGAYLRRTTDNLGTRLQFAFRFALGMKLGDFDLALGYNHFSNGKGIFGWTKTANLGENFLTLQLGYLF